MYIRDFFLIQELLRYIQYTRHTRSIGTYGIYMIHGRENCMELNFTLNLKCALLGPLHCLEKSPFYSHTKAKDSVLACLLSNDKKTLQHFYSKTLSILFNSQCLPLIFLRSPCKLLFRLRKKVKRNLFSPSLSFVDRTKGDFCFHSTISSVVF